MKKSTNINDLVKQIKTANQQLLQVNQDIVVGKEKNLHKPRQIRKNIARLLTMIHQRGYNG